MRQGFFAIDCLAEVHSQHRRQSMVVIWSCNEDRVQVLSDSIEHQPIVCKELSLAVILLLALHPLFNGFMALLIRVNYCHDVVFALCEDPIQVLYRTSACTNLGAIQLTARFGSNHVGNGRQCSDGKGGSGEGCAFEK